MYVFVGVCVGGGEGVSVKVCEGVRVCDPQEERWDLPVCWEDKYVLGLAAATDASLQIVLNSISGR